MLFRMVSSVLRSGSSQRQFVKRIPTDLRARMVGLTIVFPVGAESVPTTITDKTASIRVSLRTSSPGEAKARHAIVAAHFETLCERLRRDASSHAPLPLRLTHKQATALAGDFYRAWAAEDGGKLTAVTRNHDGTWVADPNFRAEDPELWREVALKARKAEEDGDGAELERMLGAIIDRMLLARAIVAIDAGSRAAILKAFAKALADALDNRTRNAAGDYSPDPKAARFPQWDAAPQSGKGGGVSLTGMVDAWWLEAKAAGRSPSTHESYRNAARGLVAFVKHDNAGSITTADVIGFKDHRLAAGRSPKTVNDSDIAGLRAVFSWAVSNQKLPSNPAAGIKATRSKPHRLRGKEFTEEEAAAILSHALAYTNRRERPKLVAAKRWVPWLCAYTGARVGELVQLRKSDVRQEGSDWIIDITPEAGTVKDGQARSVVVHSHLIELGFPAFVEGSATGYLFIKPSPTGETRGVWQATKNRLSEFAREVVTDKGVAPNHGWRHLFKTVGHEAGIEDSVLDAICGHAPATVGGRYGSVTLKAQRDAMTKFPRFVLDASSTEA